MLSFLFFVWTYSCSVLCSFVSIPVLSVVWHIEHELGSPLACSHPFTAKSQLWYFILYSLPVVLLWNAFLSCSLIFFFSLVDFTLCPDHAAYTRVLFHLVLYSVLWAFLSLFFPHDLSLGSLSCGHKFDLVFAFIIFLPYITFCLPFLPPPFSPDKKSFDLLISAASARFACSDSGISIFYCLAKSWQLISGLSHLKYQRLLC